MSDYNSHIYQNLPEEEQISLDLSRPEQASQPRSEPSISHELSHRSDPSFRPEHIFIKQESAMRKEPSMVENVGSVTISRVGLVATDTPASSAPSTESPVVSVSTSSSLRSMLMAGPLRPPVLESMLLHKSENEKIMEQRRYMDNFPKYANDDSLSIDYVDAETNKKLAEESDSKKESNDQRATGTSNYRKILPMPPLIKFNPPEELTPNQRLQQSLVSLLKNSQPPPTSGTYTPLEPSAPANTANVKVQQAPHLLKGMSIMSPSFKALDFANSLLFQENQRSPRNRKPNYSDHEKRIFFHLLTPYIEFLEQRSQEHYMMTMKADAWKELTNKYNDMVTEGGYVARGVEELKTFWKNVRRNSRRRSMAEGQVPDLVERLPDGSHHGNQVKSENYAPPPPSLQLPKVTTEEQQALLTLNTLAAAAAAQQQNAGAVRGFMGRHEEGGDTSSSYDHDLDIKNEPICNVTLEQSDDDPEASNSHSNSNDASSSARFSLQPGLAGPYLLKKETHCTTILDQLLKDDTFADVTLTAEGQNIRAHKMVLCLASSYFKQVLSKESNVKNVIVFRDIKYAELKNIINFIYTGEATVDATELESFMKTAEMLEISSLCEGQKHAVARGLAASASQKKRQRHDDEPQNHSKKNKVNTSPRSSKLQASNKEDYIPLLLSTVMRGDGPSEEAAQESDSENDADKSNPQEMGEQDDSCVDELLPSEFVKVEKDDDPDEESEPVPGRCPFCSAQPFTSPPEMFQHLLLHHPGTNAFPCANCLRVFSNSSHQQTHSLTCTNPLYENS